MDSPRLNALFGVLRQLPVEKLALVERMVSSYSQQAQCTTGGFSSQFGDKFSGLFGTILQTHHALSSHPFTKDKFEWAMVEVMRACGSSAENGPRGLSAHDILVENEKWSLKTQADRSIRVNELHISKFMEMGKGEWSDEKSLIGLP